MANIEGEKDNYYSDQKDLGQKANKIITNIMNKVKDENPVFIPMINMLELKEDLSVNNLSFDGEYILFNPIKIMVKMRLAGYLGLLDEFMHVFLHLILGHTERDTLADKYVQNVLIDMQVNRIYKGIKSEESDTNYSMDSYYRIINDKNSRRELLLMKNKYYSDDHNLWKRNGRLEELINFVEEQLTVGGVSLSEALEEFAGRIRSDCELWGTDSGNTIEKHSPGKKHRDFYGVVKEILSSKVCEYEHSDNIDRNLYSHGMREYNTVILEEGEDECEDKIISTLALAIDTSGSCDGNIAERFLADANDIILNLKIKMDKRSEIILFQADSKVREEVHYYYDDIKEGMFDLGKELYGFGGTSFIPVIDRLKEYSEEEDKKIDGLIYLTDGYGEYPQDKPEYPVTFCIIRERGSRLAKLKKIIPDFVEYTLLN